MKKIHFPEGATPLNDYSGLKISWVESITDLNRAEAENIFFAQKKYLLSSVEKIEKWFNPGVLKKIHRAMFGQIWEWAGIYRTSQTNIGTKPNLIPTQLTIFCGQVCSWSQMADDLMILEKAARIHHRLVSIHPFENGNGRFSRLISDRYLKACGSAYPIWPTLEHDGDVRSYYIQCLKSADRGDFEPLMKLMNRFIEKK